MPRAKSSPKQKLITAFMDLDGREQRDLVDTFTALVRRREETVASAAPVVKKARKPRAKKLPAVVAAAAGV